MEKIITYRSALPETISLLKECQKATDKKNKDIAEKIQRKASEDVNVFLKDAIKKIKKSAKQGYNQLIYQGKFIALLVTWNDEVAKLLSDKLIDLGFIVSFSKGVRHHTYDGSRFEKASLHIKWIK